MKKRNFFTTDELKPTGWLYRQLDIEARGLAGNLDKVWRDVKDSAWIGGDAEGWERVPYWLDGFIPLAYLLDDADMISRAKKYITAIVSGQKNDGWICPCDDNMRHEYDPWAIILITKVLTVYYECSKDEHIPTVIYKTLKNFHELLKNGEIKLFNWGKCRWFEAFIALNFIKKHYDEAWITELALILKAQGMNYNDYTEIWKTTEKVWRYDIHIVNLAMMLKTEAVSYELLGDEYTDIAERHYKILKEYNGTPVEIFTGDECLAGLDPTRGTEFCAVVELMYSYELLFAYTGDGKWLERLETIAFNALPATTDDLMWAHQYDQLSNQMSCIRFKDGSSYFSTNGPEAHLFGLEPNYGCCTANFGQGWPKLALSTFMYSENEIISALALPSKLSCDMADIELCTDYPFKNKLIYKINAKKDFDFTVRIPSFAEGLTVNGEKTDTKDITVSLNQGEEKEITVTFEAMPYLEKRPYGLNTVKCGSLVFSLPVSYERKMYEYVRDGVERKYPYCDYEYIPKSDWNYALTSDVFEVERCEVDAVPFSSHQPAVKIKAKGVKIAWGTNDDFDSLCAKAPKSLDKLGSEEELTLCPYGSSKLRMTELPVIK